MRSFLRSQKHPTGMFLMGSPCAPWHRPGGLFSSKRLPPFVTKRPAAPRPGCRPRCRAGGFLLSFCIAKRKKQSLSALRAAAMRRLRSETPLRRQKGSLRKGVPPSAEGGRGAAPGPRPPLKRGDGNFTGLRPCWFRLQVATFALRRVKPPKGAGRA